MNEERRQSSSSGLSQRQVESVPSAAKQQAAAAAVARLDQKKKDVTPQQRSAALIRAQAFKELELERDGNASLQKLTIKNKEALVPQLAVSGVFYKCPLIGTYSQKTVLWNKLIWNYQIFPGPEVLPKKEIEQLIKEFLYQQLDDAEAGLTACLVIHTVNKNPEKVCATNSTLTDKRTINLELLTNHRFGNAWKPYSVTWITLCKILEKRSTTKSAPKTKFFRKK